MLAHTEITPSPPSARIGKVRLSFPEKTLKFVFFVLF